MEFVVGSLISLTMERGGVMGESGLVAIRQTVSKALVHYSLGDAFAQVCQVGPVCLVYVTCEGKLYCHCLLRTRTGERTAHFAGCGAPCHGRPARHSV